MSSSQQQMTLPFGISMAEFGVDRYRCNICLTDIQGYDTLKPHCQGKNHQKRILNYTVRAHYLPTVEGKIPERLFNQIDLPMDLVWNGFVRMNVLDQYWCEVCVRPVCGIPSARQHYEGDSHRKKLMNNSSRLKLPENVNTALNNIERMGGPVFSRNAEQIPPGLEEVFCRVCGQQRYGMPPEVCQAHMERMDVLARNLPTRR